MKPVRVSQINSYIKRVMQNDPVLGNIAVIGEISNLKFHSTGHVYFSLKDNTSKLNCFLPQDIFQKLSLKLSDGMEIVAGGYIYVFEKGGTYSLNIRDVRIEGKGSLSVAFDRLKAKLAAEGLFDEKYKKDIPLFPKIIGIVTSDSGAAISDILKIISGKNDYVDIIICPVQVQGVGAAEDIASGIRKLNRRFPHMDCMIVGRGGGAAEELWAFNEEVVARSIFESVIPVISAVGHQTDFTIADFVADRRAETPTAAANMAVPDIRAIRKRMADMSGELRHSLDKKLENLSLRVRSMDKDMMSAGVGYRLDRANWRIRSALAEIGRNMEAKLDLSEQKLRLLRADLDSLDPKSILKRGYAIIEDEDGALITSASQVQRSDFLKAILYDGQLGLRVENAD
jgi:exodeoxyribonuclease VII large subunit